MRFPWISRKLANNANGSSEVRTRAYHEVHEAPDDLPKYRGVHRFIKGFIGSNLPLDGCLMWRVRWLSGNQFNRRVQRGGDRMTIRHAKATNDGLGKMTLIQRNTSPRTVPGDVNTQKMVYLPAVCHLEL